MMAGQGRGARQPRQRRRAGNADKRLAGGGGSGEQEAGDAVQEAALERDSKAAAHQGARGAGWPGEAGSSGSEARAPDFIGRGREVRRYRGEERSCRRH